MNILVINCGSSSLKYQLIDMKNETLLAKGLVERIGIEGSSLTQKAEGKEKYIVNKQMKDHNDATSLVISALTDEKYGVIKNMSEINAVGHRVVHGGEFYSESVKIDATVKKAITDCIKLAPLHNPANLIGINSCEVLMPSTPMVAVFDTAFHQTLPDYSYIYPIPYEFYTKNRIRKYGFHGTSHKYVSNRASEILSKDIKDLKMITCHIGNGTSITAIKDGKSVETSMGFTPLDGLAMGTRSGSIDPAIVIYMQRELKLSIDEIDNILNKKSGLLGLSGVSSDFRDVLNANKEGNPRAKLALEVFFNRIKSYIGSYTAILGGLDCLIFTAGVGENSREFREAICQGLEFLGINLDKDKNNIAGIERIISTDDSRVKILVVPTNEELMIARDTKNIVENL